MHITDRPGRFYALCILSPSMMHIGIKIKNEDKLRYVNSYKQISKFLIFNGIILFLYELYWLSFKNDETTI